MKTKRSHRDHPPAYAISDPASVGVNVCISSDFSYSPIIFHVKNPLINPIIKIGLRK